MIYVTKPFLPPRNEYEKYIASIWDRCQLTNNGPLVIELEKELCKYLSVPDIIFVNNGTSALQLAIKALDLEGEIITTPFSYVATTSSIVWEGCKPVFVDINEDTLNINPDKVERAITNRTTAILATHVYGNPCDINKLQDIATKNNLKIIYDAAHGFGVKYLGKSIYSYGDISTASFHSTKLFHTIEGGALFARDLEVKRKLSYMRNFGHLGDDYQYVGINAKNSEFHAAMGLVNINYIDTVIAKLKELSRHYDDELGSLNYKKIRINPDVEYNFAYYPIVVESEKLLLKIIDNLNGKGVFPRRYFFPSLNKLPYVGNSYMPISEDVSKRVLCLPMYYELTFEQVNLISSLILAF